MKKEWEDEPDRLEFRHKGFPCLIRRIPMLGHLCGYVAVPRWHLYYGSKDLDLDLNIHGGITYAGKCIEDISIPLEGSDDVWWLGFDAAHAGDLIPYRFSLENITEEDSYYESYKNIEYMKKQCISLAEQLKEVKETKDIQ